MYIRLASCCAASTSLIILMAHLPCAPFPEGSTSTRQNGYGRASQLASVYYIREILSTCVFLLHEHFSHDA